LRKNKWTARFFGSSTWDVGIGTGIAGALDSVGQHNSDRYIADLVYEDSTFHPDWVISLRTNYSHLTDENKYVILPPGVKLDSTTFTDGFIGNPDGINKIIRAETVAFYDGLAQHKLRLSAGFQQLKFEASESKNFGNGVLIGTETTVNGDLTNVTGTDFIYAPDITQYLKFISIQDEWVLSRTLELTAGIRYDD